LLFVIMMLNLGGDAVDSQRRLLRPAMWPGPLMLSAVLLAELIYALAVAGPEPAGSAMVGPHPVGEALFGPYALAVELASLMLLAGLVGAYHLARPERTAPSGGGDQW
jgi:NADH-quinone oxidoreductase subunit J